MHFSFNVEFHTYLLELDNIRVDLLEFFSEIYYLSVYFSKEFFAYT